MENDDIDGEINDEELVLELLKFSTQPSDTVYCANKIPLLYMTEDIQKDTEFYRRAVKINGIAIAWDVFDVCDKEIVLEAITHYKGLRFPNSRWRNDEETASRAIQFYLENVFYTTMIVTTLETAVRKN